MRENADIEAHLRGSREQLLIDHFQRRKAELVIDTKFKRTFRGKRIKLGVLLIHFTEELNDLDHRLRDLNGLLRWQKPLCVRTNSGSSYISRKEASARLIAELLIPSSVAA